MTLVIKTDEEKRAEAENPTPSLPSITKDEVAETFKKMMVLENIEGTFEILSAAPTHNPISFSDYIVFYKSGTTYRVYNYISDAWKKTYDSDEYTDLTDGGATTLHSHAGSSFTSRARAYNNAGQTIGNASWTKVVLDTEVFDGDGEFDSATNYRFTATTAGYYIASGAVTWPSAAIGATYRAAIRKNGSSSSLSILHASIAGYLSNFMSAVVYLAATEYLDLACYQDSGGDETLENSAAGTYLSIHRLS